MRLSVNGNRRRLFLYSAICYFALLALPAHAAQGSSSNPPFEDSPFSSWLDGKNTSQIPWTVKVTSLGLSDYQRLQATIVAFVFLDAKDISAGGGRLLSVVRLTDSRGKSYEANQSQVLKLPTPDQSNECVLSFGAYLLPGEYKVAVAIYSTASRKHNVNHQVLRIAPIPNDPLPLVWANLPAVEFFPMRTPLGLVNNSLQLSLQTIRPVHLEVLANITPSNAFKPSTAVYRLNIAALFPELNVLSQIAVKNGSLNISALELDDQQIAFEQNDVADFDSQSLWRALMAHNSNVVSATALSGGTQEASFFISEVKKRMYVGAAVHGTEAGKTTRIIIVLSNQMAFPKDEDLSSISATESCACQIFYIRTHVLLDPQTMETMRNLPPAIIGGPGNGPEGSPPPGTGPQRPQPLPPLSDKSTKIPDVDQLEKTLDPLHPHVFDVRSPEDFRKAVAEILSEIGSS